MSKTLPFRVELKRKIVHVLSLFLPLIYSILEYNKHFPGDINGLLFLGDIKYLNNEWLDAIFYYYRCLNIDSNNFHANLALAKSLVKINDFEEAINILKYILKNNTNNYDLIFNFLCN